MLSSSMKAGMTTSTTALRQSSVGVGTILSGPCSRPMTLSSVLGLITNQGAVAMLGLRAPGAPCRYQVIDGLLERVAVLEAGERAQPLERRPAPDDVLEVLAIGLQQRQVHDLRTASGALHDQRRQLVDRD